MEARPPGICVLLGGPEPGILDPLSVEPWADVRAKEAEGLPAPILRRDAPQVLLALGPQPQPWCGWVDGGPENGRPCPGSHSGTAAAPSPSQTPSPPTACPVCPGPASEGGNSHPG